MNTFLALFLSLAVSGLSVASAADPAVPLYETIEQIKAMPAAKASVAQRDSYSALLKAADGTTFRIGSDRAPQEVWHFIATLRDGRSYDFPAAFLAFEKRKFYSTPGEIRAMPACKATLTIQAPCYACFTADGGAQFTIGDPGSGVVVSSFLGSLEEGKTYELPRAFIEFHAPPAIRELARGIRGKKPEEVRAAILERFGPPARNVGSGVSIEQWDVDGGILTFHPYTGPVFNDKEGGRHFRLIETHNPVGENLLGGYEMTTRPDPANHDTKFWLGNLAFGPDGTYRFTDGGQNQAQRGAQGENFFMLHPSGTVEVRYLAPTTADTLLEMVSNGSRIAQLVLTSSDHQQANFYVISMEPSRTLVVTGDKALPFELHSGWKNFWK